MVPDERVVVASGPAGRAARTNSSYAELKPRLERAARHVAPDWLRDQLDDLVQLALVKLMRTSKVEDPDCELNDTFLYRVMHSVVVDEIRKQRRRRETAIDPTAPDPVEPSVRTNPEAMTGGQEIGAVIVDCLGKLQPNRRRAVTLYLQGHTVPEVAKRLGFTNKKAENLVYRGLAELRTDLRARGMEP